MALYSGRCGSCESFCDNWCEMRQIPVTVYGSTEDCPYYREEEYNSDEDDSSDDDWTW